MQKGATSTYLFKDFCTVFCHASLRNYSFLGSPEPTVKKTSLTRNECVESAKSFCPDSTTPNLTKKLEDQFSLYNLPMKKNKGETEIAKMGNLMANGTKHEVENLENFAIQNFAMSLLDIEDSLAMVSSNYIPFSLVNLPHIIVEERLIYRLLEEVAKANNKQLKKPGYIFDDRVLRKAEVWVVESWSDHDGSEAEENNEADQDGLEAEENNEADQDDSEAEEYNEANQDFSKAEENNEAVQDGPAAENLEMIALQNFVKSLLDIADTLTKVSMEYEKTEDMIEALPVLKRNLEDVVVADKQLTEALKKFEIERFIPGKEPFDPHRHITVDTRVDYTPGYIKAVLKDAAGKESILDDESFDLVIGMLFGADQLDDSLKYIDLTLKSGYMLSKKVFTECVRSCNNMGRLDILVSIIERCKKWQWKMITASWLFMPWNLWPNGVLLSVDEGVVAATLGFAGRTYSSTLLDESWAILRRSLRQKKAPNPESYIGKMHALASLGNLQRAFILCMNLKPFMGIPTKKHKRIYSPHSPL